MGTMNEPVGIASLAALCGQVIPGQRWVDVLKSIQSGMPPHLNQKLKISPQLAVLPIAIARAMDIQNDTKTDLLTPLTKGLSLAIDHGISATEGDLAFLREKFARVARLADIEGVKYTAESVLTAAADQRFDLLLTHRGAGENKKKQHQKTIAQLAAERHAEIFNEDASPIDRLRRAFKTPLLLHYNPHLPEHRPVAKDIAEIEGIDFRRFGREAQDAIRDPAGQKEVIVQGIRIDIERTLALCQPNIKSMRDLKIPEGMGTLAFIKELNHILSTTKENQIDFYGNQILVHETRNMKEVQAVRINNIPLPHGQVNEEFFQQLDSHLGAGCRPNEPFELAGLQILGHETNHHSGNKERLEWIVLQAKLSHHVTLPNTPEQFSLYRTNGRIVMIEKEERSSLQQTFGKYGTQIAVQALCRNHVGLTLNGECVPTARIEDLGGKKITAALGEAIGKLAPTIARVTEINKPGLDPIINQCGTAVAMAAACGEFEP